MPHCHGGEDQACLPPLVLHQTCTECCCYLRLHSATLRGGRARQQERQRTSFGSPERKESSEGGVAGLWGRRQQPLAGSASSDHTLRVWLPYKLKPLQPSDSQTRRAGTLRLISEDLLNRGREVSCMLLDRMGQWFTQRNIWKQAFTVSLRCVLRRRTRDSIEPVSVLGDRPQQLRARFRRGGFARSGNLAQ